VYTNRILELHRVDPPAGREHARLTSMTAQEIVPEDSQPQPQADRSADDTRESLSEYFARPGTAARHPESGAKANSNDGPHRSRCARVETRDSQSAIGRRAPLGAFSVGLGNRQAVVRVSSCSFTQQG
jgi:hypothetical protein